MTTFLRDLDPTAAASVLVIAITWCAMLWCWWPILRPSDKTAIARRDSSPAEDPPPQLDRYLASAVRHLATWFLIAYALWLAFYLFRAWPGHLPYVDVLEHSLTNATSFALILFYFNLSAFTRPSLRRPQYMRSALVGWAFLGSAIGIYEFLWVSQQTTAAPTPPVPFPLVYGLGQGIALFLVTGRLDSAAISDHFRAHGQNGRLMCHRAGVVVGYLYAAIQPLYPLFDRNDPLVPWLVIAALAFKVCLAIWVAILLRPPRFGLSPIQNHVYEVARFATEEVSSFERTFLRTHLNALYRRRFHERRIGYLGVEYAYLSEFKRERLGLRETLGGLWISHVYAKSSAMRRGIRPSDYITSINGMPLGHHNRLSHVLRGVPIAGTIDVTLWRKRDPAQCEGPIAYLQHTMRIRLEEYDRLIKPRQPKRSNAVLGATYLANDADHGVICRYQGKVIRIRGLQRRLTQHYYETPDAEMLRLALGQMVPGETVAVDGEMLEVGSALVPITLAMNYDHWLDAPTSQRSEGRYAPLPMDRLPSPGPMSGLRMARLTLYYPDRFLRPVTAAPLDSLNDRRARTWIFFDDGHAKLFEYHVGSESDARAALTLPIWGAVASGTIHALAGNSDTASNGVYQEGVFLSFEHDREAFVSS